MRMLWLVRDYIMSCYNHSVQGDYSRVLNFKMAALHSVKCLRGSVKCSGKKLNCKSAKDAKRLTEHFSKQRDKVFGIKKINLLKLLLILIQVINTIVTKCSKFFLYLQNLQQNSKALSNYIKTILFWRQREDHWIIFTWPLANIC